jgi:hypothetical protein
MTIFRYPAVGALLIATACDSAHESVAMESDAQVINGEASSPNQSLDRDGANMQGAASASEGSSSNVSDAGICTASLDASGCPTSYPTDPCASPGWPTAVGSCGAFAAILFGAVPHYGVCVYATADGGALVGSQGVTDIPEFCQGTAWEITAGQVPAGCATQLAFEADAASCVDAGADGSIDAADRTDGANVTDGRGADGNDPRCPPDWNACIPNQSCSPVGLSCYYGCASDGGCQNALLCLAAANDASAGAAAGFWTCWV